MTAQRKNLVLDQGATFKQSFRYKDSDGVGVDLTGYTAKFNVLERGLGAPDIALHIETAEVDSEGYIEVYISASTTLTLDAATRAYTLELTEPGGDVNRILYGQLEVRGAANV
ncbi:hypothetical protein [Rhodococcus wratislaviensis]|uniref:hypothetical protein n=1 Tax=Rhodococcus wratislaviensis TaxID=44752 RepID=UPI0011C04613|nr:hypothetical protein [Rhodococcus wratislaviensis]